MTYPSVGDDDEAEPIKSVTSDQVEGARKLLKRSPNHEMAGVLRTLMYPELQRAQPVRIRTAPPRSSKGGTFWDMRSVGDLFR